MKKLLFTISMAIITCYSFSQEPQELIEKFFTEFEKKGAEKALDNLYSTNKWMARNQDAVQNLKSKLSTIETMVGKYYGHEVIIKKQIGNSLQLYSYMVKYDRQPLRFTFEFYKPNDKWQLFGFSYDESLDDELEEAAKIYNLNLY